MATRVALVAGCRTPFVKAGGALRDVGAIDLLVHVVRGVVERSRIDPEVVELLVAGQFYPSLDAPNIAREAVLRAPLPARVPAHTVNRACASSNQAVADVAAAILLGQAEAGIACGVESLSNLPVCAGPGLAAVAREWPRARGLAARLRLLASLRPWDLAPGLPRLVEPSTGETMGQAAERMAREMGITRGEQDAFALRSQRNATAALDDGRLAAEIVAVPLPDGRLLAQDGLIRRDTTLEALAALRPVFDPQHGTLTAGNASALTDGAAALLLMSEERATRLGLEPLAFVRSWATVGLDPRGSLLLGPALAIPKALAAARLSLAEIELVELHEAFAAQVLAVLRALAPHGTLTPERLNVRGGSLALGHPFGATGARVTLSLAAEMARRGARRGLLGVCTQGGMGFAMVLERP